MNSRTLALLAGLLASWPGHGRARAQQEPTPPGGEAPAASDEPATAAPPAPVAAASTPDDAHAGAADTGFPSETCLARTICTIKDKIRWRTPAWKAETCQRVAHGVLASAHKHDFTPSLLLAIMINESDMNEKAVRLTPMGGRLVAKDSGLMGVRCIVDPKKDKCVNGNVRGMSWKELMDPVNNVEAGARELAYWRDGGALSRVVVHVRGTDGKVRAAVRDVPCKHKTHAFWAHYNHGPRYIDKGFARHYPHRIAVLDHALAKAMDVGAPELTGTITMQDYGRPARRVDKPLEARHKKLYAQILGAAGACSAVALVDTKQPARAR